MLSDQKEMEIKSEKEDAIIARRDSIRIQILKDLSSPPMSLEAFTNSILELDKRYAGEFHMFYSEVRFEGNSVRKDRKPYELKQR